MNNEVSSQRFVAIRMILATLGTMILLLLILTFVRPDMMMGALHHMEAMVGMDTPPAH